MAPPPDADAPPLEGQVLLGRYTVLDRIATGGMAVIYRGHDARLQRQVCVKVFAGLDRNVAVYRTIYEHFVQEAFALSQLQHPNILRIYDFGYLDQGGAPFYVSELMTDGTLYQHVYRQRRLSHEETTSILEPIVGALAEAHGAGIVHRDLKPSNILFGAAGKRRIVKLADFGIAKVRMESVRHRAEDTQQVVGSRVSLFSPGWAAPEQLRGEKVGPPADVFALGLLTTFMLAGQKIFPDDNTLLFALHDEGEAEAHIAKQLDAFQIEERARSAIERACRIEPEERFQNVDELLAALRAPPPVRSAPPVNEFEEDETARFPKIARPNAPRVFVGNLIDGAVLVAAGRRVRVVSMPKSDQVDIEIKPVRVRLTTILSGTTFRLHVKGLNCFLARPGARPTGAIDAERSSRYELFTNERKRIGPLLCTFPDVEEGVFVYPVGDSLLALARGAVEGAVLLDFGAARDLVLVAKPKKR